MPRSGEKQEAAFLMHGAGKQLSGGAQILGFVVVAAMGAQQRL